MNLLASLDQALRGAARENQAASVAATDAGASGPVIPIVVPSFNGGQLLLDCLERLGEAIAKVDVAGFFVALFDDDSSDGSTTRATAALRRLRVHHTIIRWRRNGGEAANVNQSFAFLHRRGFDWALLAHQDDVLSTECLASARAAVPTADAAVAVISCRNIGFGNGSESRIEEANARMTVDERAAITFFSGSAEGLESLARDVHWLPSGSLFRLSAFLASGGFTRGLRWAGDTEYLVRQVLWGGSVMHFPGVVVGHRLHDQSSSSRALLDGEDGVGLGYLLWRHSARLDRRKARSTALRHALVAARRGLRALRARQFDRVPGRLAAVRHFLLCALAISAQSERLLSARVRALIRTAGPAGVAADRLDGYVDVIAFDLDSLGRDKADGREWSNSTRSSAFAAGSATGTQSA
jgi:GT2 family glycosyltransferase